MVLFSFSSSFISTWSGCVVRKWYIRVHILIHCDLHGKYMGDNIWFWFHNMESAYTHSPIPFTFICFISFVCLFVCFLNMIFFYHFSIDYNNNFSFELTVWCGWRIEEEEERKTLRDLFYLYDICSSKAFEWLQICVLFSLLNMNTKTRLIDSTLKWCNVCVCVCVVYDSFTFTSTPLFFHTDPWYWSRREK